MYSTEYTVVSYTSRLLLFPKTMHIIRSIFHIKHLTASLTRKNSTFLYLLWLCFCLRIFHCYLFYGISKFFGVFFVYNDIDILNELKRNVGLNYNIGLYRPTLVVLSFWMLLPFLFMFIDYNLLFTISLGLDFSKLRMSIPFCWFFTFHEYLQFEYFINFIFFIIFMIWRPPSLSELTPY